MKHLLLFAAGAAVAGTAAGLASNGVLHKAAATVASAAMAANDAVTAETQAIMDDAADMRAEARRKAKIDAAVKEELAALEEDIRTKVTKRIDKEGAE